MNPTASVVSAPFDATRAAAGQRAWPVWVALTSVTSILVGAYWDISWHMTIGRDTFWTPAHLAIQLGGILAATCSAGLIFSTTFGKSAAAKAAGIGVWGFRGPLGAFLCAWGGVAMATSAPFDNWWHDAYGLDVKILSPPHMVLNLGVLGVALGGLLLVASAMNLRLAGSQAPARVWLVIGGEMLVLLLIAAWEYTYRVELHTGEAYVAIALVAPPLLLAAGHASRAKWGATTIAAVYSALLLVGLWVMPLFPAEPKLGPVYQPITHFVPLEFPLLLIVPAAVLDVLRARLGAWASWRQALALGPTFVASLLAVQWPFGDFLMTGAARNRLFGAHYFAYFTPPYAHGPRYQLISQATPALLTGLAIAVAVAMLTSALGLYGGDALRRVRR